MSNSIINKMICLRLNNAWQVIGSTTIGKAIVDLAGGESALALDMEYEKDDEGKYILDENGIPIGDPVSMIPVSWENWIKLPVRSWEMDDAIHYSNGNKILRPPIIIIAKNFERMPHKTFRGKPSTEAVWIRDNGKCGYTGKKLKRDAASLDHVIPKSRGGANDFTNVVITDKLTNSLKGNRTPEEAGLKLIRQPKNPAPIPLSCLITTPRHFSWKSFLINQDN